MGGKTAYRVGVIAGGVFCIVLLIYWVVQDRVCRSIDLQVSANRRNISEIQSRLQQPTSVDYLTLAAVPLTRNEESDYLTFLRTCAQSAKVSIVRLQTAPGGGDFKTLLAKTPADKALVDNLNPVAANVAVEGDYASLLRFTNRILSAPRLYNLNNLAWSRGKTSHETRLEFFMIRYVEQATGTAAVGTAGAQPPKP